MIIAYCRDCEVYCDASSMEYIADIRQADGSVITVAPRNRELLSTRNLMVMASDYGMSASEISLLEIYAVCSSCIAQRDVILPRG